MCGRFGLSRPERLDPKAYGLVRLPAGRPRYNIAPSQPVLAVLAGPDGRPRAAELLWGLLPPRRNEESRPIVMARAESLFSKGVFAEAARRRRCLLPADVYYEWSGRKGDVREPYAVHHRDRADFAIGAIWGRSAASDDTPLFTCAVITTAASPVVAPIHDRMPVIVRPESRGAWLDAATPDALIQEMMRSIDDADFVAERVSRHVNNTANDDPTCLLPLSDT